MSYVVTSYWAKEKELSLIIYMYRSPWKYNLWIDLYFTHWSWQVDGFLESLITYDKENIHENCLKAVRPYLADPEFDPELISSKSNAAAGLCAWAINIVKFYEVYCDVEPKRLALNKANEDLKTAQDKLATIKAKIVVRSAGWTHACFPFAFCVWFHRRWRQLLHCKSVFLAREVDVNTVCAIFNEFIMTI